MPAVDFVDVIDLPIYIEEAELDGYHRKCCENREYPT